MKCTCERLALAVLFLTVPATTQQLSNTNVTSTQEYPGLSAACQDALNTSVSCPGFLLTTSASGAILDDDHVNALCTSSCYSSLTSARAIISSACTATTDIIVYDDVAYPATFVTDQYLFSYNVSCTRNSTGAFCDPQLLTWSTDIFIDPIDECSECWLGVQALQLNNPLGYDDSLASNLIALTSSCNATGYAFTSPTAYAVNSTAMTIPASATATPPASCTGSYSVQPTDDCNSVAKALSVSTYSLLYDNNLDIYCQSFSLATTLCTPPQCTTYTWQATDTCDGVVQNFTGMTVTQFLSWNPNFNSLCRNTASFVGYEVCVSPPGGYLNYTTSTNLSATAVAATTAAPAPTNAMQGSNRNCGDWYTVVQGDTCALLSVANYISLSDFYFLNPEINANCTNLDLGIAYCVEPVGDISTYSGYSTTGGPKITVPPATFSSVNTAIPTTTYVPYTYTTSLLPTASGTISGCYKYANYDNSTNAFNDCLDVAYGYGVSIGQLVSWNPTLSPNISTCNLQPGYSYCVMQSQDSTIPSISSIGVHASSPASSGSSVISTVSQIGTSTTSASMGPTPTGVVAGCQEFYTVQSGDSCSSIVQAYSITFDEFYSWNPSIGSDCTSLWLGYAYCVNAPASSSTTNTATTTTTGTSSPKQSGIATSCDEYYTVASGDSCSKIEAQFDITFAQLYQWNPAIGDDCQSLLVGYAVCVGVPS